RNRSRAPRGILTPTIKIRAGQGGHDAQGNAQRSPMGEAAEPSQVREEAALSGSAWVPPGRLACAASGPLVSERLLLPPLRSGASGGMRERRNRHARKACVGHLAVGSNPTPSATSVVSPAPAAR